jgi:tripartite-type tricarboxylate transporter receptor subunit TctC
VSNWWAIGLRKSTPGPIIDRLNKEINAILAESEMQARLSDLGSSRFVGSSADYEAFLVRETEKWGKVIRAANIKAE